MKYVQFNTEKEYIRDFMKLSYKIYSKNNIEDTNVIKQILENKHPLCKYANMYKFLIYDGKKVVGRFAITIYPDDDTAYLGFFECVNREDVAKYIFDIAKEFVRKHKYRRIVGPVDLSFWIKYRLKINMFNKIPYTGEPYNREYYYKMFLDNNYKVYKHYTSNVYKKIDYKYQNQKFLKRYDEFITKGYVIKNLNVKEYDKILDDLYYLLTKLYSDFPVYKHISKQDFIEIFYSYKKILNPKMVKLAYYNEKLVGFFICIPNYNNMVYNLNIVNIFKILKLKRCPKEYIMLYMGVDEKHNGLGGALAYSIIKELKESELPSIGALTIDGKVTQNYAGELIKDRYEYVLMELDTDSSKSDLIEKLENI